jgi:hypothetical protein
MLSVGLRSKRNFYRQFRAHFGCTPADYRARRQGRPETCRSIEALGQDLAEPPTTDRVTYLQERQRDIFEHLGKEARAFGVLASALECYSNDLHHFNGETLSDMATLVRAQGQSTLQTADEIEALARRIQHEATSEGLETFPRELEMGRQSSPAPDEKGGAV